MSGLGLLAAQRCLGRRMPSGDPSRLRAVAASSGGFGTELRRIARVLAGCADSPGWQGAAQRGFASSVAGQLPELGRVADRYEDYAVALIGYAAVLDQLQPRLVLLRRQLDDGCGQARAVLGHPVSAVEDARLSTLASQFEQSWDEWDAALRRCRQLVGRAAAQDRDRHGWSAFGHGLVTVLSSLSPAAPLIEQPGLAGLSRALSNLGDELTVAGLVLLVVCPPAAAGCFAAAAVVSAAQLATDSTRAGRHDRSVGGGMLGLDALGALPGGRLLREGETGLRAAKTLEELAPHERVTRLVPGGGLGAHEVRGHTLLKHVAKDEKELAKRFAREPTVTRSSSFYDRQTAENAISDLLAANKSKIEEWLAQSNLELRLSARSSVAVGITLKRGQVAGTPASGVFAYLRKDARMEIGYRIHTAFPQP